MAVFRRSAWRQCLHRTSYLRLFQWQVSSYCLHILLLNICKFFRLVSTKTKPNLYTILNKLWICRIFDHRIAWNHCSDHVIVLTQTYWKSKFTRSRLETETLRSILIVYFVQPFVVDIYQRFCFLEEKHPALSRLSL